MLDPADGLVVFVVDVLQDGEYADFPDNPGEQTLGVFRVIAHNHNGAQGWENTVSILFLALAKSWKAGFRSLWLFRQGASSRIRADSKRSSCIWTLT